MPTPLSFHVRPSGILGFLKSFAGSTGTANAGIIPAMALVDSDGNALTPASASGPQPAATSQSVTPASDGGKFPVTEANGDNVALGNTGDAAWAGTGAGTAIALLKSNYSAGTGAQTVQGNVASGSADVGSPVKAGGVIAPTTLPTSTAGNRYDLQLDSYGNLRVRLVAGISATPVDTGTGSVGVAVVNGNSTASATPLNTLGYVWNGTNIIAARGDANGNYIVAKGASNLNTAQVSIGTTATQILAARAARGAATVTNTGTTDVFLGGAGVTAATGTLLPGTKGASVTIPFNGALFGIVATGTQTVSAYEVY